MTATWPMLRSATPAASVLALSADLCSAVWAVCRIGCPAAVMEILKVVPTAQAEAFLDAFAAIPRALRADLFGIHPRVGVFAVVLSVAGEHLKVLWAVIAAYSVDVVNDFTPEKWAAEHVLSDDPMLQRIGSAPKGQVVSSAYPHFDVAVPFKSTTGPAWAIGASHAPTVADSVAPLRTHRGFRLLQLPLRTLKCSLADRTNNGRHNHDCISISMSS